jgi:hypothetical protein
VLPFLFAEHGSTKEGNPASGRKTTGQQNAEEFTSAPLRYFAFGRTAITQSTPPRTNLVGMLLPIVPFGTPFGSFARRAHCSTLAYLRRANAIPLLSPQGVLHVPRETSYIHQGQHPQERNFRAPMLRKQKREHNLHAPVRALPHEQNSPTMLQQQPCQQKHHSNDAASDEIFPQTQNHTPRVHCLLLSVQPDQKEPIKGIRPLALMRASSPHHNPMRQRPRIYINLLQIEAHCLFPVVEVGNTTTLRLLVSLPPGFD